MSKNVAEYFACDVFNDEVMKARLPKPVYKAMTKTRKMGTPLDPTYADVVANAIKDWAIEHGATHYTHWFQPMTGSTAEKHDSFISPTDNGMVIMNFSGKELVKSDNRMLLILRADRGKTAAIKAQVYQLFRGKAVLRVENTTEETVELIYELSQSMLKKAEKKEKDLCSCLYALGNVEYVNIVMQNDEVSG